MKSPIIDAVFAPLNELQTEAWKDYQDSLKQYNKDVTAYRKAKPEDDALEPSEPNPEEFFVDDFTIESMVTILRNQPDRGLLASCDELASFIGGLDKYRNGARSDRPHFLKLYDGKQIKVNRKSTGVVYIPKTSVSILGGIQPATLQRIMVEDKTLEDGFWPRFAWVQIPLRPSQGIQSGSLDISQALKNHYQRLRDQDAKTYRLAKDAIEIWNRWEIGNSEKALDCAGTIKASIYPKATERAARIALIVHISNAVALGIGPPDEIPSGTLAKAIAFTQWLVKQTLQLYAEIGVHASPEVAKAMKVINRFKDRDKPLKATEVRAIFSGKAKPTLQESRDIMHLVVRLGRAVGSGADPKDKSFHILSFRKVVNLVNGDQDDYSERAEALTNRGQKVVNLVKNFPNDPKEIDHVDQKLTTIGQRPNDYEVKGSTIADQIDQNLEINVCENPPPSLEDPDDRYGGVV